MKIQAKDVKVGMEVSHGWGEWLTVKEIKKDYQKNGKELTVLIGDSIQETKKSRGRKYPDMSWRTTATLTQKSETILRVR